jgi:hypothetical protein
VHFQFTCFPQDKPISGPGGEVCRLSLHRRVRERNDEAVLHATSFPVEAKRRNGILLLSRTTSKLP